MVEDVCTGQEQHTPSGPSFFAINPMQALGIIMSMRVAHHNYSATMIFNRSYKFPKYLI